MGLGRAVEGLGPGGRVLVKINLARPAAPGCPRTHMPLLAALIHYVAAHGGRCALAEGANGYLEANLDADGFFRLVEPGTVDLVEVDAEACELVEVNGQRHYIPSCFKDFPLRIALPATTKREGMLYSGNVKLFVGAVPHRFYQEGGQTVGWRPLVHRQLDRTVANIFLAMERAAPFHWYINGGASHHQRRGGFYLDGPFIGNDALELDNYLYKRYFSDCAYPEYLAILGRRLALDS